MSTTMMSSTGRAYAIGSFLATAARVSPLLDVTQPRGFPQRRHLVAHRDELLPDKPAVAELHQRLHQRTIVDLLGVIDFTAAGDAGGVHVRDIWEVLPQARDDIAVHDLDVIDIE